VQARTGFGDPVIDSLRGSDDERITELGPQVVKKMEMGPQEFMGHEIFCSEIRFLGPIRMLGPTSVVFNTPGTHFGNSLVRRPGPTGTPGRRKKYPLAPARDFNPQKCPLVQARDFLPPKPLVPEFEVNPFDFFRMLWVMTPTSVPGFEFF